MSAPNAPVKRRLCLRASRAVALVVACAVVIASMPQAAFAQRGLPVIRDAEIENLLRDYTRPILRAAGLSQQNVEVTIINNRAFNAFVMDGRRIFVNAGALMQSETPNQLIGVLAHETGHIAGGHLAKLRTELSHASTMAVIGMLLGVGATIAGARSGQVGGNPAAVALGAPTAMMQRSLLAYQRQHEEQADRAGVKFLTATHQSARGMYETFKRFADEQLFASQGSDPYLQSHPMAADRIAALEVMARTPYWDKKDPPALQLRHDMMRAKLHGFMDQPGVVARLYPRSDDSLPARYARAISAYRYGGVRTAIDQIDGLIQSEPGNPYFYELKGQALLESGNPAAAVAPLRKAVSMAPNPVLIQVLLAHALIETGDARSADEAIGYLRRALLSDPDIADGYDHLAKAYGRKGDIAQADLAAAQAAFARGDTRTARQLAARAKTRFPVGSPGWVKADDIAAFKPPASRPGNR